MCPYSRAELNDGLPKIYTKVFHEIIHTTVVKPGNLIMGFTTRALRQQVIKYKSPLLPGSFCIKIIEAI